MRLSRLQTHGTNLGHCLMTLALVFTFLACPRIAVAQNCDWDQISLMADAFYDEEAGEWTAYAEGEDLAAGCCEHQYSMSLTASTQENTYYDATDTLSASITRTYDEAGPVVYSSYLSIGCPCANTTVASDSTGPDELALQGPACAVPTNLQQVGSGQDVGSGALQFNYSFSSSVGTVGRLSNCEVGELLQYESGKNPFPAPFPAISAATSFWGPANTGSFTDTHATPGTFRTPYFSNSINVQQSYRYHCACYNNNQPQVLSGPISIDRYVEPSGMNWRFRITKSSSSASIDPLP